MGSCGSVGVAGLTLAGGDTSGRGLYGTACDNLVGAQLVTADGDVRELGPGRNEDLYWAIRGGGGNFGVVTRLDFRLHPVVPLHSARVPPQTLAQPAPWSSLSGSALCAAPPATTLSRPQRSAHARFAGAHN
jgi:FAD/FMN-containing dehydrogenase